MPPDIADLAKAIQLALAPAFLLSGIAALLSVMAARLARIMDRARAFADAHANAAGCDHVFSAREVQALEPRRHLASVAITTTTIAALLVCLVVAALFLEVVLETPLRWLVSALFTAGMFALVIGLTFFLREVHLAMRTARIVVPQAASAGDRRSRSRAKKATESRRIADDSHGTAFYSERQTV